MNLISRFKDSKKYFNRYVELNFHRIRLLAPFLILFMGSEFFGDLSDVLHPGETAEFVPLRFLGDNFLYNKAFMFIDLSMIVVSLLILILSFIYRRNSNKFRKFFNGAVTVYGILLLLISVAAIIVDVSTYNEADMIFFYFIALVDTTVLFINPVVIVPSVLISNIVLWGLIFYNNWATEFFPYKPYCVFIILTMCLSAIARRIHLSKTFGHEEQIENLKAEAEHENELKSLFLANMSHEIRTPMNAIIGMSELALDFKLEDSEKNTIRQIRSSGLNLVNIINDILDFSKIESGKMEIVPVNYDLLKMVFDTANIARVKMAGKKIDFKIEISPDIPLIHSGDDMRLRQILINLLGNASKFTEKGFIILRIQQVEKHEDREVLRFCVIDSGVGIRPEDQKKLFGAFQQLDMKMNRTKGGTGLGLSISRNLVKLMGGKMDVKSEYGKGSMFYFDVPQKICGDRVCGDVYGPLFDAAKANSYHPEMKDLPVDTLMNRKEFCSLFAEDSGAVDFICPEAKILVVDDNEVNLQVAQGLLRKFGVEPLICMSGFDALELLEKQRFDLVFMDHQMPVMDGVETLVKLRKKEEERGKKTVVVALSANAVSSAREMFMKNGFDDFVAKPVQGKDFSRCLKKWLRPELLKEGSVAEENDSVIPEDFFNREIKGVDMNEAVEKSGGFANWLTVARTYANTVSKNSDYMQQLLDSKDFKNYTIQVHALKSSSKIIGALEISERAKELESLGNRIQSVKEEYENLLKEIVEKNGVLLGLYRELGENLKPVVVAEMVKESEKNEVSDQEIKACIQSLIQASESNDLAGVEDSFEELKNMRLPENLQQKMSQLEEAVENIDFDVIQNLLG